MSVDKCKRSIPLFIFARSFTLVFGLLFMADSSALNESYSPTAWDYIFYTFVLSGVAFSAALIVAYKAYQWLLYVLFALLLIINVAGMDGALAYLVGGGDFALWVVPFLLTASIAAYGYLMIALRLDRSHVLDRFRNVFIVLAMVSAVFPLSSFYWLGRISLSTMWVPVNLLFFGMILGQVLPPLTWPSTDSRLDHIIRAFPVVVGLLAIGTYLVHFSSSGFTQRELYILNRIALLLFAAFSLTIVIWQAFLGTREKEVAERRALEAARNEAEMQLALMQSEKEYENALSVVARSRSRLAAVSHDLKQPISALRMSIDQMQRARAGQGEDRLARAIDYIDSLARSYIDGGISGELSVGQINNVHTGVEPVSTIVFAGTLRQMFTDEASKRDVTLKIICPDNRINVEPLATMRVMTNLIGNAIAHADASRILVGFRRKGDKVVFQVHDDGCGMDDETMIRVLEPGGKGNTSDGQGLGLGIVQELCQVEGMPFTLISSPGRGTSAYIEMELIS